MKQQKQVDFLFSRRFEAGDLQGNKQNWQIIKKKEVTEADFIDLSLVQFIRDCEDFSRSRAMSSSSKLTPKLVYKESKETIPTQQTRDDNCELVPSKFKPVLGSQKTAGLRRWKSLSILLRSVALLRRYEVVRLQKREEIGGHLDYFCEGMDTGKNMSMSNRKKKPRREAMEGFLKKNDFFEAVSIGSSKSCEFIRGYLKELPEMYSSHS